MPYFYHFILALTILERVIELVVSRRNARWSFAQGGREFGEGHYPWMVLLHTSFFLGCVFEPMFCEWPIPSWLPGVAIFVVILTQGLRWWVITTLGRQWNTRVIIVPGLARVQKGPFQFLNHPNYVAVVLELAFLPLIGGAFITSIVFSLLNFWLLRVRIKVENQALASLHG